MRRPGAALWCAGRRTVLICLMLAGAVQALAQPAQPPSVPGRTHTVRSGDTLWDVSRRYLGRPLSWPGVQQRNGVGEPRQLQVGRVLHFDDAERLAVVLAATGDVRLTEIGGPLLAAGVRLAEGSLVRTGPDSFVTLRMPDGSRVSLPSNSVVRLERFFDGGGRPSVLLDLQAGDVEARVPPRSRAPAADAWRIRTRMATVGVRGTHFRVSLPNAANTAVSVLESTVAVVAPARFQGSVPAAKGLLAGSDPLAGLVQDLLPAPEWLEPGRPQNQPSIVLAWRGVLGAASHHVQLARDAEFQEVVAEQRLPPGGGHDEAVFEGLGPGGYFARVAAVTPQGLEGLESVTGFLRAPIVLDGQVRWLAATGEMDFSWSPVPGAIYALDIAEDTAFTRRVVGAEGLRSEQVRVQALPPGQYWWRLRADVVDQGQRTEVTGPVRPLQVEGVR